MRSQKKLKPVSVGDCVSVYVSEFDRGRGDPPNVIGVVLEIKGETFKIGTRGGIIKDWLHRNCFELLKYKNLKKENIPLNITSLREIVKILSVGNGQGFKKCSCKGNCQNNKCKCYKNKMVCNSACHSGKSCENHD